MVFVDGENLTIRAQKWAESMNSTLIPSLYYRKDVYLWTVGGPYASPDLAAWHDEWIGGSPIRSFYYTSITGDSDEVTKVTEHLWAMGFQPEVFKKARPDQKAKGVDIALTKDMLSHAFLGNYEIAILVAGDGDYVPLVQEVKRLGKRVHLAFLNNGLNPDLKLACDRFIDLTTTFHHPGLVKS